MGEGTPAMPDLHWSWRFALADGRLTRDAWVTVVQQIYAQVQQAATIKSFDDYFLVVAVACALAILPARLLKAGCSRRSGRTGKA